MNPFNHPLAKEAEAAAANVLAIAGHVIRNADQAPALAVEVTKWVADGARQARPETLAAREAKCVVCPNWIPLPGAPSVKHCRLCKCLKAKLSLATARCPKIPPEWLEETL